MKYFLLLLCLSIMAQCAISELTEKQMKATKKLIRNTCQNKAKATTEELDAMVKGNFNQGKNAQCYQLCILNTYKLLKSDNTFDWQAGVNALKANAPERIAGPGSASIKNCKDALKTKDDKCKGATEIAQCIYEDNPENYFLP
uniref:Odorant binding protein 1 n=1 Tax=Colaphellus bowringi TaxID=561076 RepID=A0A0S3J2N0_9CUCU|nr:odorant binding protein 1 [Colaphellus bowringi]